MNNGITVSAGNIALTTASGTITTPSTGFLIGPYKNAATATASITTAGAITGASLALGTGDILTVGAITATEAISYEFWRIPSTGQIIGGTWVSANEESSALYNIGATRVNYATGILIEAGYCIAGGQGAGKFTSQSQIQSVSSAKRGYIAQNIDSTDSNVFVMVGSGIGGGSSNTFATIQWREVK